MCRIVNHAQSVPVGYRLDGVHGTGRTVDMNRQDRLRVGPDQGFDAVRIQVEGRLVNIAKNRPDAIPEQHVSRCRECERRSDYFSAVDSQRVQSHQQGNRAVAKQAQMFDTQVFAQAALELLVQYAFIGKPTPLPYSPQVVGVFIERRHGRPCNIHGLAEPVFTHDPIDRRSPVGGTRPARQAHVLSGRHGCGK